MKKLSVLGAAVVLLAVTGCDNDPAAGQAKAQASAATEAAAAPAAASDVVQVDLKSQDGAVEFVGAKITDKHAGSFKEFSGVISLVDGDIEKSSVKVSIDVGSMEIEPAKLKGHLLGEDFFDAAKFPKAEFSSTVIKKGADGDATHTVTGNLDLHGQKKSITFPATIQASGGKVSIDASFAINRKDFGIVYPGMPDDLIKDDVLIVLKLNPSQS